MRSGNFRDGFSQLELFLRFCSDIELELGWQNVLSLSAKIQIIARFSCKIKFYFGFFCQTHFSIFFSAPFLRLFMAIYYFQDTLVHFELICLEIKFDNRFFVDVWVCQCICICGACALVSVGLIRWWVDI